MDSIAQDLVKLHKICSKNLLLGKKGHKRSKTLMERLETFMQTVKNGERL
jgi:uncharacterized protein YdeI (YjbR/CyaY-like superfamily)